MKCEACGKLTKDGKQLDSGQFVCAECALELECPHHVVARRVNWLHIALAFFVGIGMATICVMQLSPNRDAATQSKSIPIGVTSDAKVSDELAERVEALELKIKNARLLTENEYLKVKFFALEVDDSLDNLIRRVDDLNRGPFTQGSSLPFLGSGVEGVDAIDVESWRKLYPEEK